MRKLIVVDIDGTISDAEWRSKKYLRGEDGNDRKKKDWDTFFSECDKDEPIRPICEMVRHLSQHYDVIWCSGRRQSSRHKTEEWILKHVYENYLGNQPLEQWFLLRNDKDFRHDIEAKPEMLDNWFKDHEEYSRDDIAFFIEDRNSMVKKWRELGYTVLQPQEGDF